MGKPRPKGGQGRRFCLVLPGGAVVTSTVLPAALYRPSRRPFTIIPGYPLPSFPRQRESRTALPYAATVLAGRRRIPAYAGRTVAGQLE